MNSVTSKIPIDMVFTYVDGSDPVHLEKRHRYRSESSDATLSKNVSDTGDIDIRFFDVGEITFSVNSVLKYLPWIRKIFIVTDAQVPHLASHLLNSGQVQIIDHREIIPAQCLPTFNSRAIGSFLYRIDGLSEIFLHNNDDVMHFSLINPSFFFTINGNRSISLKLHTHPAYFRWIKRQYSRLSQYRTNIYSSGIANAYDHLRRCRHRLACYEIIFPIHSTLVIRKSTAWRVEEEFGPILEETRRRRFRDAKDISYYTILYSMEKKWNPHDRLHLHLFGNLSAWDPHDRIYRHLFRYLSAPHAMFDFPSSSVSENIELFWKQVAGSNAGLACLNNIPPGERKRFVDIMMEKGLGDRTQEVVPEPSREEGLDHV